MHLRTLKRRLKDLGLRRRRTNYDENLLREYIKREIQGPGPLVVTATFGILFAYDAIYMFRGVWLRGSLKNWIRKE